MKHQVSDNESAVTPERSFALVGHPLGHSFSQAFFTEKFRTENISARYLNFDVESVDGLRRIVADDPTLCGLNVTIPYKRDVMALLDELDPAAAEIGAVNVIRVTRGKGISSKFGDDIFLKGFNSDVIGFTDALAPLVRGRENSVALVLGTGGASRAVVAGLRRLGLEPVLVSRSSRPGLITYADISASMLAGVSVIVNTTPLGTWPETGACPDIPYGLLLPGTVAFDLVYNPVITEFMTRCAGRGCTVKNGLEMLHGQAVAAWRIWNAGS